jgi:asparagine synthase (glutamine-hydrolysing)
MHVFFADMEDFAYYIRTRLSVNWRHIAARLLAGFSLSRECALNELEDLPGGEQITLSPSAETRTALWCPSQFCVENGLESEDRAIRELRSVVMSAVHTLTNEHLNILLLLSGGLDSSIVTSCISRQTRSPAVTCLNFYITGDRSAYSSELILPGVSRENLAKARRTAGSADERKFARMVATKCGFQLLEKERSLFILDVDKIHNAPLAPRPSGYVSLGDEDDLECEVASESKATACFAGQAGDTVFYATLRAIGALDYAYVHPFGSGLLHHALRTAALSGESLAHVLAKVVKYGFLRAPLPSPFETMKRPHLLRDELALGVPGDYFHHPWLDGSTRLCPGKHNHVLGVTASVPLYYNIYRRERVAPSVHPLASQPVVETCLQIPTYVLLADGVSRGLARRAFREFLPPEVARRTVKGGGWSFYENVVRLNIPVIREQLLDGTLVREGLLDRSKLAAYLNRDQLFLTVRPEQIMDYLACEAWVHQMQCLPPQCRPRGASSVVQSESAEHLLPTVRKNGELVSSFLHRGHTAPGP